MTPPRQACLPQRNCVPVSPRARRNPVPPDRASAATPAIGGIGEGLEDAVHSKVARRDRLDSTPGARRPGRCSTRGPGLPVATPVGRCSDPGTVAVTLRNPRSTSAAPKQGVEIGLGSGRHGPAARRRGRRRTTAFYSWRISPPTAGRGYARLCPGPPRVHHILPMRRFLRARCRQKTRGRHGFVHAIDWGRRCVRVVRHDVLFICFSGP
jgi:hypothetical protein